MVPGPWPGSVDECGGMSLFWKVGNDSSPGPVRHAMTHDQYKRWAVYLSSELFDLDLTTADFRTSVDVKHNDNGYSTRMARVNLIHNAGAASQNSSRKGLKALTDVRGHSPIFANSRSFSRAVGGAASSELIEDQIDQTIRLKTPRSPALGLTGLGVLRVCAAVFSVRNLATTVEIWLRACTGLT
jgi:hypothetical protein